MRSNGLRSAALVPVLAAAVAAARAQTPVNGKTTVTTPAGAHVVLTLAVADPAAKTAQASALVVKVDGREDQHVIVTPGVGRTSYDALLGPLSAGRHEIAIEPSPHWTWIDGVAIRRVTARVVAAEDPQASVLAHAPAFGVRADTIGTASDLPLLLYAEDQRTGGSGWVRYSLIFSNEDGGTPPAALMARWGRTTDIELAYEAEWQGGRIVQERIQAPNHEVLPFRGTRLGQHPFLLVATLNNMFVDRGASVATVRPVPVPAQLAGATRESMMDGRPWLYRQMARELQTEGRIGKQVEDPREFLYVEARLDLEHATVAVLAQNAGGWADSSRGQDPLRVERSGWVRLAIPASASASALKWSCRADAKRAGPGRCRIETTRAFRLDDDFQPGQNRIEKSSNDLAAGDDSTPQVVSR